MLVGRCWEAGGAPAYWPWVQALRAYVRDADSKTLRAELGAGAPMSHRFFRSYASSTRIFQNHLRSNPREHAFGSSIRRRRS